MADKWKNNEPVFDLLDEMYCCRTTLQDYLQHVFIQYAVDEKKRSSIFDFGDAEDKEMFQNIIVACSCSISLIPENLELFTSYISQVDLIQAIIETRCNRHKEFDHILSRGSSRQRHDSSHGCMVSSYIVQNDYPNSMVSYLSSYAWENLLSNIGGDLMSHLISKMSMFLKMPNKCLVQICGKRFIKQDIQKCIHGCIFKSRKGIEGQDGMKIDCGDKVKREHVFFSQENGINTMKNGVNQLRENGNNNAESGMMCKEMVTDRRINTTKDGENQLQGHQKNNTESGTMCKEMTNDCGMLIKSAECGIHVPAPLNLKKRFFEVSLDQPRASGTKLNPIGVLERTTIDLLETESILEHPSKRQRENDVSLPHQIADFLDNKCHIIVERGKREAVRSKDTNTGSQDHFFALEYMQINKRDVDFKNVEEGANSKKEEIHACGTKLINNESAAITSKIKGKDRNIKADEYFGTNHVENVIKRNPENGSNNKSCLVAKTRSNVIPRIRSSKKHTPLRVQGDENKIFRMRKILYSRTSTESLSKYHILRNVTVSKKGASNLASHVFSFDKISSRRKIPKPAKIAETGKYVKEVRLSKNLQRSLKLLRSCIRKFKKLKIKHLLNELCPSSSNVRKLFKSYCSKRDRKLAQKHQKQQGKAGFDKKQLLLYRSAVQDYIQPYKVFSFVKTVCQRTFPTTLLGSKKNWRQLFGNLKRFFKLGRNEFLTLQFMMKGIKCSLCYWMYKSRRRQKYVPPSFSNWQEKVLGNFVCWIIADFVMPLVKACFYVTESGPHRNKIFYYRKSCWKAIEVLARDSCFGTDFVRVEKDFVEDAIERHGAIGCSKIRFIPKANKIRPIINMKMPHSKKNPFDGPLPDVKLKRLFSVLKLLQAKDAELLGSTVSNLNEVRVKLKKFLTNIRRQEIPELKLYFVALDVVCCFDTIPQDKLITVVNESMKDHEYLIRKFDTTSYITHKQIKSTRRFVAANDRDCDHFPTFLKKYLMSKESNISNAIITDGVFYATEERHELLSLLSNHIKQSFVQVGNDYYHHIQGIPQGSFLSTLLCNIIYGDMERNYLQDFIDSNDSVLMRWTDDFLFISTSEDAAVEFIAKMRKGFPEYGCNINWRKSSTNVAVKLPDKIKRHDGQWFPWCSLLFEVTTLDVSVSYNRYVGQSIGDSISLRLDSNPGKRLLSRMMQQIRIQSSALILDPELNCRENILTNIYRIFRFTVVKFHYHVINLPKDGQPNAKPKFFRRVVQSILNAFCKQYKRVCGKFFRNIGQFIERKKIKQLFFAAFFNGLNKKRSRYSKLLKLMRKDCNLKRGQKIDDEQYYSENELFESILF